MAAEKLALFILAGGQDIVFYPSGVELGAAYEELKQWLWMHGYQPIGTPMLNWNTSMQRQIRQPIMPRLQASFSDPRYRLLERPEMLMVQLDVPMKSGRYNLAGLYDLLQEYNLDAIGAPYVPIDPSPPLEANNATVYVPVVPRGTTCLIPMNTWLAKKTGLQIEVPAIGVALKRREAWRQTALTMARSALIAILGAIIIGPSCIGFMWLLDPQQTRILAALMVSSGGILGSIGMLLALIIGGIGVHQRLQSIDHWNTFWTSIPTPPLLMFYEAENGNTNTTI